MGGDRFLPRFGDAPDGGLPFGQLPCPPSPSWPPLPGYEHCFNKVYMPRTLPPAPALIQPAKKKCDPFSPDWPGCQEPGCGKVGQMPCPPSQQKEGDTRKLLRIQGFIRGRIRLIVNLSPSNWILPIGSSHYVPTGYLLVSIKVIPLFGTTPKHVLILGPQAANWAPTPVAQFAVPYKDCKIKCEPTSPAQGDSQDPLKLTFLGPHLSDYKFDWAKFAVKPLPGTTALVEQSSVLTIDSMPTLPGITREIGASASLWPSDWANPIGDPATLSANLSETREQE